MANVETNTRTGAPVAGALTPPGIDDARVRTVGRPLRLVSAAAGVDSVAGRPEAVSAPDPADGSNSDTDPPADRPGRRGLLARWRRFRHDHPALAWLSALAAVATVIATAFTVLDFLRDGDGDGTDGPTSDGTTTIVEPTPPTLPPATEPPGPQPPAAAPPAPQPTPPEPLATQPTRTAPTQPRAVTQPPTSVPSSTTPTTATPTTAPPVPSTLAPPTTTTPPPVETARLLPSGLISSPAQGDRVGVLDEAAADPGYYTDVVVDVQDTSESAPVWLLSRSNEGVYYPLAELPGGESSHYTYVFTPDEVAGASTTLLLIATDPENSASYEAGRYNPLPEHLVKGERLTAITVWCCEALAAPADRSDGLELLESEGDNAVVAEDGGVRQDPDVPPEPRAPEGAAS